MISIARGVAANLVMAARKVHLFYGGRAPRDICGEDSIREFPGFGERFFYYPTISLPESEGAQQLTGKVGFVHKMALHLLGNKLPEHEIYFAGPPAMAQAVQRMLMQEKVPGAQVHYDAFY